MNRVVQLFALPAADPEPRRIAKMAAVLETGQQVAPYSGMFREVDAAPFRRARERRVAQLNAALKTLELAAGVGVTVAASQGDLATYDLGRGAWNGIVSIFAHLPPSVRAPLHRRVVDALAPGGVLLLEAYTPAQIGRGTGGPPVPELTMTLDALRVELDGLEFEHGAELEREVVEGAGHTGLAAVVQLVARKPS